LVDMAHGHPSEALPGLVLQRFQFKTEEFELVVRELEVELDCVRRPARDLTDNL
jgi:hypothetical protein